MTKPILMVVDDHAEYLKSIADNLSKRYSADYEIKATESAQDALAQLDSLTAAGRQIAVVLAALRSSGSNAIDFLERAQELCPQTKRVLRVSWLDTGNSRVFLRSMALGIIINFYDPLPVNTPDEHLSLIHI